MIPGERTGHEKFQRGPNGLLPHQLGQRHARVVNTREDLPKSIPGFVVKGAGTYDVIARLKSGRVVVCILAGTHEEGGRTILILPNRTSEVFPCGSVVSAQL